MAAIKPLNIAADKWQRRASVAGQDYKQGVQNPRTEWEGAAIAANDLYAQAVTAAANAGRYGEGVRAAGNARWKNNALRKGPGRFTEGVGLAVGEWSRKFEPFHRAIAAITIPDRGPKGTNLQRVSALNLEMMRVAGTLPGGST